jgi:hypothetical protein
MVDGGFRLDLCIMDEIFEKQLRNWDNGNNARYFN